MPVRPRQTTTPRPRSTLVSSVEEVKSMAHETERMVQQPNAPIASMEAPNSTCNSFTDLAGSNS